MKMTSAIIRVFCWSLVAVVLTAVLIGALAFDLLSSWGAGVFKLNTSGWYREEKLSGPYTVQHTYTVDQAVTHLDVDWRFGQVTVVLDDTLDSIQLMELAQRPLKPDEKLQYTTDAGELKVQYSPKQGFHLFRKMASKQLEVRIPPGLKRWSSLQVSTHSADIAVRGLSVDTLNLDNVSGKITAGDVEAENGTIHTVSGRITVTDSKVGSLKLNTVSGNIQAQGRFDSLQSESVSGDLRLAAEVCPNRVQANSVSGKVTLEFPDNDGFTMEYDTVSGTLSCDFPISEKNHKKVYKNGSATLDVNTVSGDFIIREIKD